MNEVKEVKWLTDELNHQMQPPSNKYFQQQCLSRVAAKDGHKGPVLEPKPINWLERY